MAKKLTMQQRFGVTPGKLVLVLLLGGAFIGVLYYQFADIVFPPTPAVAKVDTDKAKSKRASAKRPTASSKSSSKPAVVKKSGTSPSRKSVVSPSTARKKAPAMTTEQLVAAVAATEIRQWPVVDLQAAIMHDPFAMPATIEEIAGVSEEQTLPVVDDGVLAATEERQAKAERELALLKKERAGKRAVLLAKAKAEFEAKVAAEQKKIQATIDRIQNNGVPIVMVSANTRVVQIDKKIYEENDTFEGIRVVKIEEEGTVVLVRAEDPPEFVPPPELLVEDLPDFAAEDEAEEDDLKSPSA